MASDTLKLPGCIDHETAKFMEWPILPAPGGHFRLARDDTPPEGSVEVDLGQLFRPISE